MATPVCLEGMLLEVLKFKVVDRATNKESYATLFTKPVLDETDKEAIVSLRELLANK